MSSRGTAAMLTLLCVAAAAPQSARGDFRGGIFCTTCRGFADSVDYGTVGTGLGVVALSLGALVDLNDPWQPVWFTIAQPLVVVANLLYMSALALFVTPRLTMMIPMAAIDLAVLVHTIFRLSHPPIPEVPAQAPIARDAFFRPYSSTISWKPACRQSRPSIEELVMR